MSKQKFQIDDNVYVKRGRKNEIGRVGKVANIIYKSFNRLCYIVIFNDVNYPKSGAFYADMLAFSDIHSLANHMQKEDSVKNENTKCKYCGVSFKEIPESELESGVCEYCAEKQAMISEITMKKSANVDLHEFSIYGQDGDWLEVTEWVNGEGIDINIEKTKELSKNISLTYDELEAIINIVNKFGALPPIYTKKEIEK